MLDAQDLPASLRSITSIQQTRLCMRSCQCTLHSTATSIRLTRTLFPAVSLQCYINFSLNPPNQQARKFCCSSFALNEVQELFALNTGSRWNRSLLVRQLTFPSFSSPQVTFEVPHSKDGLQKSGALILFDQVISPQTGKMREVSATTPAKLCCILHHISQVLAQSFGLWSYSFAISITPSSFNAYHSIIISSIRLSFRCCWYRSEFPW